jgi:hypothetical protein
VQRRSTAIAIAPNREDAFEDFVKNRIYYLVRERLRLGTADLSVPDAEVRKLSLAGGLMARVANIDRTLTSEERDAMITVLQTDWGVSHVAAALIAEVAVSAVASDLDYFRLTRTFSAARMTTSVRTSSTCFSTWPMPTAGSQLRSRRRSAASLRA